MDASRVVPIQATHVGPTTAMTMPLGGGYGDLSSLSMMGLGMAFPYGGPIPREGSGMGVGYGLMDVFPPNPNVEHDATTHRAGLVNLHHTYPLLNPPAAGGSSGASKSHPPADGPSEHPNMQPLPVFNIMGKTAAESLRIPDSSPHAVEKYADHAALTIATSAVDVHYPFKKLLFSIRVEKTGDPAGIGVGIASSQCTEFRFLRTALAEIQHLWILGDLCTSNFTSEASEFKLPIGCVVQLGLNTNLTTRETVMTLTVDRRRIERQLIMPEGIEQHGITFKLAVMLRQKGDRVRFICSEGQSAMEMCKLWLSGGCHRKNCKYKHIPKIFPLFRLLAMQQRQSADLTKRENFMDEKKSECEVGEAKSVLTAALGPNLRTCDELCDELVLAIQCSAEDEVNDAVKETLSRYPHETPGVMPALQHASWDTASERFTESWDDNRSGLLVDRLMDLRTGKPAGDVYAAAVAVMRSNNETNPERLLFANRMWELYRRDRLTSEQVSYMIGEMCVRATKHEPSADGYLRAMIHLLRKYDRKDAKWRGLVDLGKHAGVLREAASQQRPPSYMYGMAMEIHT